MRYLFAECIAALRLLAIFMRRRPDVVHLYQNQTKMAILAARIAGVKRIVYTETALIADWFTPSQVSVMKFFWNRCDAVIALSKTMKEHLESLGLAAHKKVYLVPTMFPFSTVCAGESATKEKKDICVGIIGRLAPEKGHIYFLQAAVLIGKKRPEVKFIIAGEGYLQPELLGLVQKAGLAAKTEFTGRFRDLKEVMRRIDILALSSLTEGLPLVLLEAIAFRKAIVATGVGGVAELIQDGETGLLVPAKDSAAMASAILRLVDDPEMRSGLAAKALERFKNEYSTEAIVPKIELIYEGGKN